MVIDWNGTIEAGVRIGHYIVTKPLGKGAFGTVYEAYPMEDPGERVALKLMNAITNAEQALWEPELLARFKHPHIVKIKGSFLFENCLVLVMELVEGVCLQNLFHNDGVPVLQPDQIAIFLDQMTNALQAVHAMHVIHRDIKLSNIMMTGQGRNARFTLIDFGLGFFKEGVIVASNKSGTIRYMAPEQIRGRPEPASDFWSLGVCAYALLYGTLPFGGDDIKAQICYDRPPMKDLKIEGSEEVRYIINGLLEKQVINRIAGSDKMIENLRTYFPDHFSELGETTASHTPTPTGHPAGSGHGSLEWQIQHYRNRRRRAWIVFWLWPILPSIAYFPYGMLGLMMILIGIYQLYRSHELPWQIIRKGVAILLIFWGWIFFIPLDSVQDRLLFDEQRFGDLLVRISDLERQFLPWSFAEAFDKLPYPHYVRVLGVRMVLHFFWFTFIAAGFSNLTRVRQNQRMLLVLGRLQKGGNASDDLGFQREMVDLYPGDINIHFHYIENLRNHGYIKESLIEAEIFLQYDPYNTQANLILADNYLRLGLYRQCTKVCDRYLSIVPYAFEFRDLKIRSAQLTGSTL